MNKLSKLPLIALAALPLTVGAVLAQTGTLAQTQRVQPAQPGQQNRSATPGTQQNSQQNQRGPQNQSGTNYADVFLQKLAAQLGVSVARLKAAAVAAGNATVDQGVKAGDFPQDRAADMKSFLQQNPFALGGGRGPGMGHRHGGPDGDGGRGDMRGPGGQDQGGQNPGSTNQGTTDQSNS